MPHFSSLERSLPDYPISPKSEWFDYMDDTDTLFYEQKFIDMITGESNNHPTHANTDDDLFAMAANGSSSTASRKSFAYNTDLSVESHREWTLKELRHWSASDVMDWIVSVANRHNYNYELIHMPSFNEDGITLGNMTETEFVARAPQFGRTLYLSMQGIREGYGCERIAAQLPPFTQSFCSDSDKPSTLAPREQTDTYTELSGGNAYRAAAESSQPEAVSESDSESSVVPLPPVKRLPGRPRGTRTKKKPEKRCGRLWEFIRDLLLNREYCPSLICWDDYENGVFRFVHSEKVARLWGTIKENPKMTYEKLSRAMRYYYKSKVLQPVLGRRLVYKFGPTATGWRTPNPNFRLSD